MIPVFSQAQVINVDPGQVNFNMGDGLCSLYEAAQSIIDGNPADAACEVPIPGLNVISLAAGSVYMLDADPDLDSIYLPIADFILDGNGATIMRAPAGPEITMLLFNNVGGIDNLTLANAGAGTAVSLFALNVSINNVDFVNNGTSVSMSTSSNISIQNSTFRGAGTELGIIASEASFEVRNSTFSGLNTAIDINTGSVALNNVTIADNQTGITASMAGGSMISNTIIDNPTGTNCTGEVLVSGGFNIDSDSSCGFSAAGDMNGVDPLLGPLANNGGSTFTHLPQLNSPAVDGSQAASVPCENNDQRGVSRDFDGDGDLTADCDIGAVEVEVFDLDLSVTSMVSMPSALPGDFLSYTITVSNAGPAGDGMVDVSTPFPAELINVSWSCFAMSPSQCSSGDVGDIIDTASIANGDSVQYNVNAQVDPMATDDFFTTTTVSAGPGLLDTTPTNNSATSGVMLAVQNFDLTISKTDNVTTANPGDLLTYIIRVDHIGDSSVSGTVTDMFPVGLTNVTWSCTPGLKSGCSPAGTGDINDSIFLTFGDFLEYTVNATVDPGFTGTLTNTATVAVDMPAVDPNLVNNVATDDTIVVLPNTDLAITKTDNLITASPGDVLNYSIMVEHLGDVAVPAATVTDLFPSGLININWFCIADPGASCPANGNGDINAAVSLNPMSSLTFTVSAEVDAAFTGSLQNTADVVVNPPEVDPALANNSSTDMTEITPIMADLVISKMVDLAEANPGDVITYTVIVEHLSGQAGNPVEDPDGDVILVEALVTDTFSPLLTNVNWTCTANGFSECVPAGTGNINEVVLINQDEQLIFTITGTVVQGAAGDILNQASVTAQSAVDIDLSNNTSATVSTTVNTAFDLSITKTDGQSSSTPGSTLTYTIIASNNSDNTINAARVTDILPPALADVSWTCTAGSGASCSVASGTGDIDVLVNFVANSFVTFSVLATISENFEGTLQNTARVSTPAGIDDQFPGNNQATDTTIIGAQADLHVTMLVPDQVVNGSTLVIDAGILNFGPNDAVELVLRNQFSAGLILQSVDSELFSCAESMSAMVICQADSLPANNLASLSFTFEVNAAVEEMVSNTLTIAADTADPMLANNQVTGTTLVVAPLALTPDGNTLPDASTGTDYMATILAIGGIDPVDIEIAGIPDGLNAVVGGPASGRAVLISGIPVRAGISEIQIIAEDSSEPLQMVERSYSLQVLTDLVLAPDVLPAANTDAEYLSTVVPLNGVPPYIIELVGLPPGLTHNNGIIQGQPTVVGTFDIQADALDSQGNSGGRDYTLVVQSGLQIPDQSLPPAVINVSYGYQLMFSGGQAPNSWSGGNGLPAGLTLSDTGFISGVPQAVGEFNFNATVGDTAGGASTGQFILDVLPEGLVQQQIIFPNGLVGVPYETPTAVAGGELPYECMLLESNLPPGLVLNGCNLGISGVPLQGGSFEFVLAVVDNQEPSQTLIIPARIQIAQQTPIPIDQPPDLGFQPPSNVPVGDFGVDSPADGFADESAQAVAVDAFGNRYLTGFGWNGGNYDIRILKYDVDGNLVWSQRFDSGSQDYAYGITLSPLDQSLYVGGYSLQGNQYAAVLLRYDLAGVLQQTIIDDIGSQVKAYYALQADMSGVYAVGENYNGSDFDGLVVRYDHAGNRLFQILQDNGDSETAYAAALSNCDGNGDCDLMIGGFQGDVAPTGWLASVSRAGGSMQMLAQIPDSIFALQQFANGDWLVGSSSNSNDWVIRRVTASGTSIWATTVSQGERLRGVAIDQGGFVLAAGSTSGPGSSDGLLVSLDGQGQQLNAMTFDSGMSELFTGSLIGPEGILTLIGERSMLNDTRFLLLNLNTGKAF